MTKRFVAFALATLVGASAAGMASAQTLGERVSSGSMSESAFQQLIVSTGLTPQEASGLTLDEVVAIRWQND